MIYFYNTFHNGDIHHSRTFVKDLITKLNNNDYYYLHNNNPNILKDIKNLKHDKSFITFDNWRLISNYPISYFDQIIEKNDDLYINTWVGQGNWLTKNGTNRNRDNRYCSLYSHYELYQDIFDNLNLQINDIDYYLPDIDFNFVEKNNIDLFFNQKKYDISILIVNNDALTVRIPIDFDSVVNRLSSKYSNVLFILTKKSNIQKDNVVYTNDIIKLDFDLNEIGYLAKYCNIIVGRPSGPYCFSMNKGTLNNNKIFITISDNIYDCFYFETNDDMQLLTDHSTDGLCTLLENKINNI